jgi:type II secretory pathway pseudopilin PulG
MNWNLRSAWRSSERGFLTLIGLLIVIVIIGILFAMYAGGPSGAPSSATGGAATTLGGAKGRAGDTVCRNNLSQLRAAIGVYSGTTGANPPSLEGLQAGVSLNCPRGGEPYEYDPNSGKVWCVHPGHESF